MFTKMYSFFTVTSKQKREQTRHRDAPVFVSAGGTCK